MKAATQNILCRENDINWKINKWKIYSQPEVGKVQMQNG